MRIFTSTQKEAQDIAIFKREQLKIVIGVISGRLWATNMDKYDYEKLGFDTPPTHPVLLERCEGLLYSYLQKIVE